MGLLPIGSSQVCPCPLAVKQINYPTIVERLGQWAARKRRFVGFHVPALTRKSNDG
jgi:hypothetical protein